MPKEITHFALASELSRFIPGNTLFHGPVKEFPNLFLLGAVAPDIPFFYQAGRNREGVQNLSAPFHRTDGRALEPVLDFLARDSSPPALALAAGVIVVEAPRRSGALLTARQANDLGRPVWAVPGPVDLDSSRGCHHLLREGAHLLESVSDVDQVLGDRARDELSGRLQGQQAEHCRQRAISGTFEAN